MNQSEEWDSEAQKRDVGVQSVPPRLVIYRLKLEPGEDVARISASALWHRI